MTYGIIPDEIIIVSSVMQPVFRHWEDDPGGKALPQDNAEILKPEKEMVTPAFVVEAGNSKTLVTAVSWAERHRSYYDYEQKKQIKKADPVVQDKRKNDPMKDLRIVTLDIRGNGGRAYKILTKDNYYFDVREDVLLDAMIKEGIRKGGFLNGEYIWARTASQMKIVRIGSDLHTALIQSTSKSKQKRLGTKELIPGNAYANKRGESYVYLGRVNAVDFDYRREYGSYSYSGNRSVTETITRRDIKNGHMWVNATSWNKEKTIRERYEWAKSSVYYTHVSTAAPTFIECVEELGLDAKKEIEDFRNLAGAKNSSINDLCRYSTIATATPTGEPFTLSAAYQTIAQQAIVLTKAKTA